MSLDPSKFKNVKEKKEANLITVIMVCALIAPFTYGLSMIYMLYYTIKYISNFAKENNNNFKVKDNLYEELQDENTKDHYRYDIDDISQQELHEHREDFWNENSPIKYK